jgi:SPP1 gp7 family putative phage head morphogenesis protein
MPLPTDKIDELITGVYEGSISVFELPSWLYAYTVYELDGSFFAGFGDVPRGDVRTIEKAVNFRSNIGRFSGAKTFNEVKDLTDFVFDEDGRKRPFAQFKERALKIDENYNLNWLRTEQDSVILQSQNARKWIKYESEAEIFPVLQYVTVGDDRVRPSHAELDGLKRRVDDPIWREIWPQNGWGCRCTVIQLEETNITSKRKMNRQTKDIKKDFKKGNNPFDYNPGMTEYIFKESGKGQHPYFKVPRVFSDDLKNNFGFPGTDEVTGRFL